MASAIRVAPSILAADFTNLGESIRTMETGGGDLFHLDVMDGQFVPNISFGPLVVQAVERVTSLPLDVHLMIEEPIRYVDAFADAGADWLTIHVEACDDVAATIEAIRARDVKPGISLRPGTPLSDIEPFLGSVDLVLVMTVEPGFGGQSYRSDQESKLTRARHLRDSGGFDYAIEVDGGISRTTAPAAVAAGAEILVAGSALFGADDPAAFIRDLQEMEIGRR